MEYSKKISDFVGFIKFLLSASNDYECSGMWDAKISGGGQWAPIKIKSDPSSHAILAVSIAGDYPAAGVHRIWMNWVLIPDPRIV